MFRFCVLIIVLFCNFEKRITKSTPSVYSSYNWIIEVGLHSMFLVVWVISLAGIFAWFSYLFD